MYALYNKIQNNDSTRYQFLKQVSLFGCNEGYIPQLLSQQLSTSSTEPMSWHVNIENSLRSVERDNQTLVIDLKPNSKKPNLSLYEVSNVWGYSTSGWTPILLHLRGLFIDEDPSRFDKDDFIRAPAEVDEPIFSMMYLQGTVDRGQLVGKWTTPGPSPTNSVLLWPDAFKYFWQEAKKVMDVEARQ